MNKYDIEHERMKNALVQVMQAELRARSGLISGSAEDKIAAARSFAAEIREVCGDLRKLGVLA